MYVPKHFEELRVEPMHELMRACPLATLVTLGAAGLSANHLPFALLADPLPYGTLQCHVARANPVWQDGPAEVEALVVFHGPDAYISPSWYPSKQQTGKVVPTWNYAVVHAYGRLRVIEDAKWLRTLVEGLTNRHEADLPDPWQVSDAPLAYTENLLGAIVGIEIVVTKLIGKWKASQNRPDADRTGVINGLRDSGQSHSLRMAELVERAAE